MRLRSPADARCASPQALARHNVLSAPLMVFPTLRAAMGESLADEEEGLERATYLGFVDTLDLLSGLIASLPPWVGVGAGAAACAASTSWAPARAWPAARSILMPARIPSVASASTVPSSADLARPSHSLSPGLLDRKSFTGLRSAGTLWIRSESRC